MAEIFFIATNLSIQDERAKRCGYEWDTDVTFFKGDYTPANKPALVGTESGGYYYIITASYGGNIYAKFWEKAKIGNPNFKLCN